MRKKFEKFVANESGATAIEYAMMAMLIGVSGVFSFRLAGGNLEQLYLLVQATLANLKA